MSRKLAVVLASMLILVAAMGLKTAVATHSDSSVLMANGGAPAPPPRPDPPVRPAPQEPGS